MTTFEHIVTEENIGQRIDKVLVSLYTNYSRQQIQNWIKDGFVKVNDERVKANYKCKNEDIVQVLIPEEKVETIEPEKMALDIQYEDDYIIVINKDRGMLVHPTHSEKSGTLVNALLNHSDRLSTIGGEDRPGIVHRLDKDTSGLLIIAKDDRTHEQLKMQFQNQTVERVYEAIVFGNVQHDKGIIRAPIGRNPKDRLQMAIVEDGKYAETHFTVLQRWQQYTLVECELKTGRTHQIRVHMKYMNHPIVGDQVYCRKKSNLIAGQALFAKRLSFIHPHTEQQMEFEIDRPSYFKNVIEKLEKIT